MLINGAFGIGKTSAARAVVRADRRFRISDPERIGYVLKRLPPWLPWSTRALEDYQVSAVWQRLTIRQANRHAGRPGGVVLLPLCITDRDWFDSLRADLADAGHRVDAWCLIASWETVAARLAGRGVLEQSSAGRWSYPRARAALSAHRAGHFGELIDTEGRTVADVAQQPG